MKFKAVLFDLDGTLLDTLEDLADSMNTVLETSGYPKHNKEAYKYFVGNGLRNLAMRVLPGEAQDEDSVEHHFAAMKEEYGRRWDKKTKPYDGIPGLLDSLAERNIKMAILSNKSAEFTKLIVDKLLSQWNFKPVLGERPLVPKKPDPAGALEISGQLGIPVNEFLYLGDTNVDMMTATSAGMYAVGALWGFRKADELVAGGARLLIPQPASLLDLL